MTAFANRLPVGPGSRGGAWHNPEYRREYQRAWRAAHPEYREAERLRRARERARRNGDPAGIEAVASNGYPRPLPSAAQPCRCSCGCTDMAPGTGFVSWVKASVAAGATHEAIAAAAGLTRRHVVRIANGQSAMVRGPYGSRPVACGFCLQGMHEEAAG